jgi:hypothetical protein
MRRTMSYLGLAVLLFLASTPGTSQTCTQTILPTGAGGWPDDENINARLNNDPHPSDPNQIPGVGAWGTLCLSPGTYYLDHELNLPRQGQTLRSQYEDSKGSTRRAKLVFALDPFVPATLTYPHTILLHQPNQRLGSLDVESGMPLTCNPFGSLTINRNPVVLVNPGAGNASIEGLWTKGTAGAAVFDVLAPASHISNNYLEGAGYMNNPDEYWADGIRLHGDGHYVGGNTIYNATDIAVVLWGSGIFVWGNTIISDNNKLLAGINWGESIGRNNRLESNLIQTVNSGVISQGISVGRAVWSCGWCDYGTRTDAAGSWIGRGSSKNVFSGSGFGWLIAVNGADGLTVDLNANNGSGATIVPGSSGSCMPGGATATKFAIAPSGALDLAECSSRYPHNGWGGVTGTYGTGWTTVNQNSLRNLPQHPPAPRVLPRCSWMK